MTPADFKDNSKKHLMHAALEVLSNVVTNGKCDDTNLDVTRSSSLPTLLISIVRNVAKSDVKVPELLADLVENIALLCKNSFNKQVGIELIYMKGFIPLFPTLIKDTNERLQLATLKALGTFSSLAAIIPLRMQQFFKDITESGTLKEVAALFHGNGSNTIIATNVVALECLSTLMCPVYGDFYSFPWKRGPHDNILEYTEAQTTFEEAREQIFNEIRDFDFVGRALAIFSSEDQKAHEAKHLEVKCSVLRFFNQILRTFDNSYSQMRQAEGALDMFLSNPNLKSVLANAAFNSKSPIV